MSMTWMRSLAAACAVLGAGPAVAAWPDDKPIRIVVPFAAGGTTDVLARLVGQHLSARLKQTVVVDNKPGAGSMLGSAEVARANGDGYTLLMGSTANALNHFFYRKPAYDIRSDLLPISQLTSNPNFLAVHKGLPVENIAALVKLAKDKPGTLSCAHSGIGSSPFVSCELFKAMTRVEITSVAYRGGAPAIQDVIAGTASMFFQSEGLPYIQSGQVKPLGVTTPKRAPQLPHVPAIGEAIPGYELTAWFGLFGPKDLPAPIAERMANEVRVILALPEVQARIDAIGAQAVGSNPKAFKAFIEGQLLTFAKLIPKMNVSLD